MAQNSFSKLSYVPQAYVEVSFAGVKPMEDIETILKRNGAKNIGLKKFKVSFHIIKKALNYLNYCVAYFRMPCEGTVFLQYPLQYGLKKIFKRARQRNNRIIILIHDIDELRNLYGCNYDDILENASYVILHTENMQNWFRHKFPMNQGSATLGIFDCLMDENLEPQTISSQKDRKYDIVFAGNLRKSTFLKKIPAQPNIRYHLYGKGINPQELPEHMIYEGITTPVKLISIQKAYDFGLVWDGDSKDECSGDYGQYLKYNSPYKASSYLCSGLPLIIWDKMALKQFVEDNNIGFSVASLDEIPTRLQNLSIDDYTTMRRNAEQMGQKIRKGEFTYAAIEKAVSYLT